MQPNQPALTPFLLTETHACRQRAVRPCSQPPAIPAKPPTFSTGISPATQSPAVSAAAAQPPRAALPVRRLLRDVVRVSVWDGGACVRERCRLVILGVPSSPRCSTPPLQVTSRLFFFQATGLLSPHEPAALLLGFECLPTLYCPSRSPWKGSAAGSRLATLPSYVNVVYLSFMQPGG